MSSLKDPRRLSLLRCGPEHKIAKENQNTTIIKDKIEKNEKQKLFFKKILSLDSLSKSPSL